MTGARKIVDIVTAPMCQRKIGSYAFYFCVDMRHSS
jgi:hypothetical protein